MQQLTPRLFSQSSICVGEVFASYLARHRYRSTPLRAAQLYSSFRPSWILPTRLDEYVEALGDYIGSVDQVIANNTLFPGFNRFLSTTSSEFVLTRLRDKDTRFMSPSLTGMDHGHALRRNWAPGICLECLSEDVSPDGEAFWRRDFLLVHIRHCARHGTRIHEFCDTCAHGFRGSTVVTTPTNRCLCGKPLVPRPHSTEHDAAQLEFDLARGWSKLLTSDFAPNIRGPEMWALMQRQAQHLGFVRDARISWGKFAEFFAQSGLKTMATSIGFPFRNNSVAEALRGQKPMANPIQALFLLIALYGSWSAVEAAIKSEMLTRPLPHNPKRVNRKHLSPNRGQSKRDRLLAQSIAMLPETCRLYENFRDANPHLPHSSIMRLLPWLNQYAVRIDRLRAHGVTQIPTRKRLEFSAEMDASAASHIENRWKEMIQAGARFRITGYRLLRGHPMASNWGRPEIRARSPMTAIALNKYVDTMMTRMRRALHVDVLAGKVPGWAVEDAAKLDEMTDREISLLWRRLRKKK